MAATNQRTGARRLPRKQAQPRRGRARAARGTRQGKTEGRWIHHEDAAALWRGLCASCKTSLQRLSQNVQQLVRDAGAGLDRLRERAAVPAALGSGSSGNAHGTASPNKRGTARKGAKQSASDSSSRKTTGRSTKKKAAAKKRTAEPKARTSGSRKTTRAKTASRRSGSQSVRRAAKARTANSGGKKRAGRKK